MESLLIVLLGICFIGLLFCGIILIRTQMIYKYRMKALEVTSKKAISAIKTGDLYWRKFYDEWEEAGSFDSMLYALHKWKYTQFYPEI